MDGVAHQSRAALLRGYHTIAFHVVLAAFGIVFLGWNLPATLLHWLLPRPWGDGRRPVT
ncbi:MAG: hypothetical protein WDN49_00750 [Acetobacteraceae bacterium]